MELERFLQLVHEYEQKKDLKGLESLEKYFTHTPEEAPLPFSVGVEFAPKGIQSKESSSALPALNALSRAKRRLAYNKKLLIGYDGPRIVAEGDSWFAYPLRLYDVINCLMEDFAVYSLAGAGDLLADMAQADEYTPIIEKEQARYFLLSGGGNDLLGGGNLSNYLNDYVEGATPESLLNRSIFNSFRDQIIATLREIVIRVTSQFPKLYVLLNGYDYIFPFENGKWLMSALNEHGIPAPVGVGVMRLIIDELNTALQSIETDFPGRVYHVDCRNVVGPIEEWYDELHPKDPGYRRVADCFAERIRAIEMSGGSAEFLDKQRNIARMSAILSNQTDVGNPSVAAKVMLGTHMSESSEAIIHPTNPPSADTLFPKSTVQSEQEKAALKVWQGMLDSEDRRAYEHVLELQSKSAKIDESEMQNRREMMSGNDPFALERIIGISDMYQVNFLSRGVRAVKSVARVSVINSYGMQMGFGSGFLIAPGLFLTNNHVIRSDDLILNSHVLFDYEYDADNRLMMSERFQFTNEIFLTNPDLDYSIISVEKLGYTGKRIEDFGWLILIPESGKAVRDEYVSIIQHPSGLPKQLALRGSQVIGRKEQYFYYTTDTNPGSSGAPVLNDDWLPVALHHRSVPDFNKPNTYIANRGIRISSILEDIEQKKKTNPIAIKILEQLRLGLPIASLKSATSLIGNGTTTTEAYREPWHEDLTTTPRGGYQSNFLGLEVPLPTIKSNHKSKVASLLDGSGNILKYEHFSIVMHKARRLALFTASNVDASPARKQPGSRPKADYSRKGLSGLGKSDIEKWFIDPRIAPEHQLPDIFFKKDKGSFDKGHLVRREDAAWGDSYSEMRRANGDTYHVTNCSPQVSNFNQTSKGGEWGKLEDYVLQAAKTEKLCVFAGPILDPNDQVFKGVDDDGSELAVQIPSRFWKLVVARDGSELQSFAFVLPQDLGGVPLEFDVNEHWKEFMVPVSQLESLVKIITFPEPIRQSDQYETE